MVARVEELAAKAPDTIVVERCSGGGGAHWTPEDAAGAELGVRREIGGHKELMDVHRYAPLLDRARGRSRVGCLITS